MWPADDRERPLSPRGARQAEVLAGELAAAGVERLLSSPAQRCRETLEPAARALGRPVEPIAALAEGHSGAGALALLESLDRPTALCSHGDVIGAVLDLLEERGMIAAGRRVAAKASTWELRLDAGVVVAARYLERAAARRRASPG